VTKLQSKLKRRNTKRKEMALTIVKYTYVILTLFRSYVRCKDQQSMTSYSQ